MRYKTKKLHAIQCLHGERILHDIGDKIGCQKSQEPLQDPFPEKNRQFGNYLVHLHF